MSRWDTEIRRVFVGLPVVDALPDLIVIRAIAADRFAFAED